METDYVTYLHISSTARYRLKNINKCANYDSLKQYFVLFLNS